MFKELIDAIQAGTSIQTFQSIEGANLYSRELYSEPCKESISSLTGYSLTGLIEFIKVALRDPQYDLELIKVQSASKVELYSKPDPRKGNRTLYYRSLFPPQGSSLSEESIGWYGVERMIPTLQSGFIKTDVREQLLEFLSHISIQDSRELVDDGIQQSVVVKTDVAKVAQLPLPKDLILAPHRTFSEVDQPSSSFVLRRRRMNSTIELKLYLCDNGAWEIEAMNNIAKFLSQGIGSITPIEGNTINLPIII